MAGKKHLFSNTGYYATQLVSATIEDAAKDEIVLTFSKSVRPFLRSVKTEFTCVGTAKTVGSIVVDTVAKTLTVIVTVAYANGNTCTLVHNPAAPNKGATVNTVVTNNVV
ncbi:unnamed protein product [marine sediment metagenome]|uniref:Uncharacterized protein n=1 Tax=marine sediment metagenome TaxID=412755 RepID=X0X4Y7_9ZZZZ